MKTTLIVLAVFTVVHLVIAYLFWASGCNFESRSFITGIYAFVSLFFSVIISIGYILGEYLDIPHKDTQHTSSTYIIGSSRSQVGDGAAAF